MRDLTFSRRSLLDGADSGFSSLPPNLYPAGIGVPLIGPEMFFTFPCMSTFGVVAIAGSLSGEGVRSGIGCLRGLTDIRRLLFFLRDWSGVLRSA